MNLFHKILILFASACWLTGCETANSPQSRGGEASILINLREQRAYLIQGKQQVASARISTGREGHATPVGDFRVIRKDLDHRSGIYGAFVDADRRIVQGDADARKDHAPPNTHFLGASMPYFVEFSPGFGLHEGNRPGYPASHGCVRMSSWKARQFFNSTKVGTRVTIRN